MKMLEGKINALAQEIKNMAKTLESKIDNVAQTQKSDLNNMMKTLGTMIEEQGKRLLLLQYLIAAMVAMTGIALSVLKG